jgi:fatty acid-binding protein DegV
MKNNQINPIEKPRTRGKSLSRLCELTEAFGPLERVGVVHADSPLDAQNIIEQIKRFHDGEIILGNIGPGLATHGGPGIIGVCAVKRKLN